MMISDEPDGDADTLDDETVPVADAGTESVTQVAGSATDSNVREWTLPHGASDTGADSNASTLAWFKGNHADWRAAPRIVPRLGAEESQPLQSAQPVARVGRLFGAPVVPANAHPGARPIYQRAARLPLPLPAKARDARALTTA
jgi:hypothetical protein